MVTVAVFVIVGLARKVAFDGVIGLLIALMIDGVVRVCLIFPAKLSLENPALLYLNAI